jgi:hypothetical protein
VGEVSPSRAHALAALANLAMKNDVLAFYEPGEVLVTEVMLGESRVIDLNPDELTNGSPQRFNAEPIVDAQRRPCWRYQ